MSAVTKPAQQRRSVLLDMASRFNMEPAAFEATLRNTVVPAEASREQFAAFLLVAKEYHLNPITREIYAFPARNGGIQPIVSIDGWMKIINNRPEFDGIEFEDKLNDEGGIMAITCKIYRKDRSRPVSVTEYMDECARPTDTWKRWPARMLRHKAAIQAARYAFGFSGIVDEDEAQRIIDVTPSQKDDAPPKQQEQQPTEASRAKQLVQQRMEKQAEPEPQVEVAEPADEVQPEIGF